MSKRPFDIIFTMGGYQYAIETKVFSNGYKWYLSEVKEHQHEALKQTMYGGFDYSEIWVNVQNGDIDFIARIPVGHFLTVKQIGVKSLSADELRNKYDTIYKNDGGLWALNGL